MWSSQLKLGIVSAFCIAKARTFESTLAATKCDAWVKTGDCVLEGCSTICSRRVWRNAAIRQNQKKKSNRRSWRSPLSHTVHEHATPQNLGHELLQTTINLPHLVILIWSTNSMWLYEFASVKYLSRNQDTFCLSQCAPSPSLASLDEL